MKPTTGLFITIFIVGESLGMLWAWSDYNAGRCLGCGNYGSSSHYSSSRVAMP